MVYNPDKNLKLYYSTGEVAEMLNIPEPTLRHWEKEFPNILNPRRAGRNIRQYTEADIEQVRLIQHLVKEKGMTHAGARQVLKSDQKDEAATTAEIVERLKSVREELIAIRNEIDRNVVY
jgi:DNA-binding transcriptional MerR regulator